MVIQLEIQNLSRNASSKTITEAIQSLDPEAEVETYLQSKQVTVKTEASESSVIEVLVSAGYCVSLAKPFFYDL